LPPSLVLVVLSDQIGVGVGDLFLGALIPGLILSGLYILYIIYVAITAPEKVPALPPEARTVRGWALARQALIAVVPPVFLIFAVLGSIFQGFATPTEASTGNITALVIMILFCSSYFGLVFDELGGQSYVKGLLTNLPGGFWGFVIVANIVIFLLGINLEFIEISFIAMPLFVPAAQALGVDLAWFGVMMAINLNMAFISPPVGFSLFYLQSVAPPEVKTIDIHKGALPFMVLQGIALIIVILFPETVTWLIDLSNK